MSTPIIQNLIPLAKEQATNQIKRYLEGTGDLGNILDDLEFWYDRFRDKEQPDLPMWHDLPSTDADRLFDAWIEAVEEFFAQRRGSGSDLVTSPLPVSSTSPASSVVPAPLVPEVVKEALERLLKACEGHGTTAVEYSEWQARMSKAVTHAQAVLRNYSPAPSPSVELLREALVNSREITGSSRKGDGVHTHLLSAQEGSVCEVELLGEVTKFLEQADEHITRCQYLLDSSAPMLAKDAAHDAGCAISDADRALAKLKGMPSPPSPETVLPPQPTDR